MSQRYYIYCKFKFLFTEESCTSWLTFSCLRNLHDCFHCFFIFSCCRVRLVEPVCYRVGEKSCWPQKAFAQLAASSPSLEFILVFFLWVRKPRDVFIYEPSMSVLPPLLLQSARELLVTHVERAEEIAGQVASWNKFHSSLVRGQDRP